VHLLAILASLHLQVHGNCWRCSGRCANECDAANVRLTAVTLDTDTTVHTLYGRQMGARKSYNPKNKGRRASSPF